MNELISVVVPIYNVEKYISRCINSIINQTYKNLEIILVDDGSTDKCPLICDNYLNFDKRIKVIHKNNGGLSDARNSGIEIAQGEYIIFIDSDDYVDNKMIEILYKTIKNENCDIAICNYYMVDEISLKKKSISKLKEKVRIVYGKEKFDYLYNEYKMLSVVAWNKLYKKEIFKDIRYPLGKLNEDEYIICDILSKANRIAFIKDSLYYYVQRSNSIIHSFNMKRFDILDSIKDRAIFFKNNGDVENCMSTKLLEYLLTLNLLADYYNSNLRNKAFEMDKVKRIYHLRNEIKKYPFKNITLKDKIRLLFPNMYMLLKTKNRVLLLKSNEE